MLKRRNINVIQGFSSPVVDFVSGGFYLFRHKQPLDGRARAVRPPCFEVSMIGAIAKRLFGSRNDRFIKSLCPIASAVNAKEAEVEGLEDSALRDRTAWLRERLGAGETRDDILVDAFATVREAAKRTLKQRHFDVQLMGGVVLHRGMISEMGTGEGKTLVATLPVYLNALPAKGVHVITVNDYLAKRDAEWMGQIYRFLGLTVGCIQSGLNDVDRRAAYACDVTYGTNNEFGFDYLRDNMKYAIEDMVHRDFNYAIVDEVDSILIDEARTPLIISGPGQDHTDLYDRVDKVIPSLSEDHYEKDEKQRSITFTDVGTEYAEELLREHGILTEGGLYDLHNMSLVHHLNQALKAHHIFTRDVQYLVKDGRIQLIDEFTGRVMEGRRLSDGLHQAIEAKEGVDVQNENQTLASITFQNYFRMYPKLAGMTGTALTEAEEFGEIYGLDVIEVPPNVPRIRIDGHDEVYRTVEEKYDAIVDLIAECNERAQPVLIGTVSIEKSETLAEILRKRKKLKPQVLNAKYHEQEAYIIAQAGVPGSITIATNMAGRGTDIQLGGNADYRIAQDEVTKASPLSDDEKKTIRDDVEEKKKTALAGGGLYVVATERHESRRIDNQLRGRSGRQGDPGASKFYLSLQDDLMRIFGSDRMDTVLQRLGLQPGEPISHPWVNKAIAKAQQKVEARNFDIRKTLLQYDDVMNDQRRVIFEQRREIMMSDDVSQLVTDMRHDVILDLVAKFVPEKAMHEEWDIPGLHAECLRLLNLDVPLMGKTGWAAEEGIADEEIRDRLIEASDAKIDAKKSAIGDDLMRRVEKSFVLQMIDQAWRDHLAQLDMLRQAVNLRAFGQKTPLLEYQRESFDMFEVLLTGLRERVSGALSRVELRREPAPEDLRPKAPSQMQAVKKEARSGIGASRPVGDVAARRSLPRVDPNARNPGDPSTWGKVSRNESCPCGSGKKYKHCHGAVKKVA